MKKILFTLLLFTGFLQAQTYPVNPTKFGKISLNTNTESTTATKVNVQESNNEINIMSPKDLPVYISPQPTNYTIPDTKLGSHLKGIDNRLGQIGNTTAGITNRIYFTGVLTTITAGTFYTSSATGKGAVAGVLQTVSNDDNVKNYFGQDVISIAQPSATTAPPGNYSGQLSVMVDNNSAQERFTVEIYKTNNAGTPIASGITGAPVGNLGVTVVAILDSGVLDLVQSSVSNVSVSGNLASTLSLATGERLRYHVSSQKVGTAGNAFMFSLFYGSDYNSYYDVTVTPTTDGVINKSTVTGVTATDAFNSLNTDKENISNKAIDFTTVNNTLYPTVQATKTYADNLVVGLLNDRGSYDASTNLYPSTGGSGVGGVILKGNIWSVTVPGVLGGANVGVGDWIRALVNSPGQTSSNWAVVEGNFGYVPANDANVIHTNANSEIKIGSLTSNTGFISGTFSSLASISLQSATNTSLFLRQGARTPFQIFGNLGNVKINPNGTGSDLVNNGYALEVVGTVRATSTFTLGTSPTESLGTFEFLTRNTVSGADLGKVEKLPLANVQSAVVTNAAIDAAKPNIALTTSPTFTGTPAAPTPTTPNGIANKGYVDGLISTTDTNALHKSGDETFTGIKSSINTGSSFTNGIDATNNGTGSSYSFRSTNTSTGVGIRSNNTGSGFGISSVNSSNGRGIVNTNLAGGEGIYNINSTGSTSAGFVNYSISSTGNAFEARDSGGIKFKVAVSGIVTATPAVLDTELATLGQVNKNKLISYTFATLPASPTQGDSYSITDALAPAYLAPAVGGGSVYAPVVWNGTTWVCH